MLLIKYISNIFQETFSENLHTSTQKEATLRKALINSLF